MIFTAVLHVHQSPSAAKGITLRMTSRILHHREPLGGQGAEEDMRSNRGRGLSPTLPGSQSRARLCVNGGKIVGGV